MATPAGWRARLSHLSPPDVHCAPLGDSLQFLLDCHGRVDAHQLPIRRVQYPYGALHALLNLRLGMMMPRCFNIILWSSFLLPGTTPPGLSFLLRADFCDKSN